ncbi:uncharacterized protein DUF3311 [Herbihabitans rhizosphaerae]|uniref:Uncharacterized protein DUF3311 n=1 Tax=Herbihabitans rhizosphaerae TaxID=1872711 RepID=A0A4Q7KMH3_9PSEU|nr:DUF3311 domain-containing protein [Herbihabitans rhizosphaerae]RZS37745.1 uncharacterized protein DUF3311 [Herbihabitans rhizosphaerae]
MSARPARPGLRWSNWNLLLAIPLLFLLTPVFNRETPALFGMPFFYWFQFVGIVVGVLCTSIVYFKTRDTPVVRDAPDRLGVDDLDEGSAK